MMEDDEDQAWSPVVMSAMPLATDAIRNGRPTQHLRNQAGKAAVPELSSLWNLRTTR